MAPCAIDFEVELEYTWTQIHYWLNVIITFRSLLEHVYSKASQQTKNTVADKRNVALHIHMGNIFNNLQY